MLTVDVKGSGGTIVKLNVVLVVCVYKVPLSVIVTVKILSSNVPIGVPEITPVAELKDKPPPTNAGTTEYA